ncbi:hypothetical protein KJ785_03545 [Patescibacteria group bacterium]|nr:hypothetical protein [Patescibacteria group bacterium]
MLQKKYLGKIKKNLHSYHTKRGEVIGESNNALHHAKRAIFALHRDNVKEATEKIDLVEKILKSINTKYKSTPKIFNEGSYKAALEEYVEAKCFFDFLQTGKIGEIKTLPIAEEIYLAGLCDVPGELYRYAIKSATNKDIAMTKKCAEMAQEIIGELIEFNLTSYLRTKFDQAKGAVQRLEIVVYELSLRKD